MGNELVADDGVRCRVISGEVDTVPGLVANVKQGVGEEIGKVSLSQLKTMMLRCGTLSQEQIDARHQVVTAQMLTPSRFRPFAMTRRG